jgi:hypothetical protein
MGLLRDAISEGAEQHQKDEGGDGDCAAAQKSCTFSALVSGHFGISGIGNQWVIRVWQVSPSMYSHGF